MNKVVNKILGSGSREIAQRENVKPKTSGKLFDWCQERIKPLGLHIDNVTDYSLAVWRGNDVVGYYNNLSEIKKAIIGGYVDLPNR